ncbi:unnamed protein product [Caenorhabditis bovis]|uniref:Uncharacterized protein n=1 Tax=Caenorhabditis bovis TaxID=2654633 RepID=A0A8S1EFH8_9PELO|nr:unnamed protein product [Caenorhabditis bovis]
MTSIAVVNGQKRDSSGSTGAAQVDTTTATAPTAPQSEGANGNNGAAAAATNGQNGGGANGAQQRERRCEIYRYTSDKPLYAAAWSYRTDSKFRLAVGTCVEMAQGNKVSIVQLKEETQELAEIASFNHDFPANAVGFIPDHENNYPDLLATTGDCLRIWKVNGSNVEQDVALNNATQFSAPLTNFDWNETDLRLMGTSSIDTTCTIYDIEVETAIAAVKPTSFTVKTQLIAHDKPVHDIGFSKVNNGRDHFATVGADGSARMFDLRRLEHSTIVYEDPQKTPLMRLAWNKQEPYYLATFAQDSNEVVIIDIRMPCNALTRLKNHNGAVNGIAWAPHSPHHICTAADDAQALIWDIQHIPRPVEDPILAYSAAGEVNQVHWGFVHSNWICICFNKSLEILRV